MCKPPYTQPHCICSSVLALALISCPLMHLFCSCARRNRSPGTERIPCGDTSSVLNNKNKDGGTDFAVEEPGSVHSFEVGVLVVMQLRLSMHSSSPCLCDTSRKMFASFSVIFIPYLIKRACPSACLQVRLVLEYCDKGCLRSALDSEAFLCDTGLNYVSLRLCAALYFCCGMHTCSSNTHTHTHTTQNTLTRICYAQAAILDTALDIARAMFHLHCNNVVHADLKPRNVLLSSAGAEGRGVHCKIADFGAWFLPCWEGMMYTVS